ncbi:hypothetical protein [Enterovibrio norvegicus]|uniref:hypothetical protein n=1 Tax=Enterovibrio norvegicus TaxID=188144 RepID=UPI0013044806|nr:hypothetical protein [Enterovibrio norvegicus]
MELLTPVVEDIAPVALEISIRGLPVDPVRSICGVQLEEGTDPIWYPGLPLLCE